MGNCAKLKWNRKRLGMSQKEFAVKVGLCVNTITKLETDETAWNTIRGETEDKICAMFDSMASWQPENAKDIMEITRSTESKPEGEEKIEESRPRVTYRTYIEKLEDKLTKEDEKALILIEFAYEELSRAKTHEDFTASINMLKRIVDKY